MLLLTSVLMLWVNMFLGVALLLITIVLHTFGGFGVAEQLRGNTRIRIIGFVVAWSLTLAFSVLSQFVYPDFADLFSSFGRSLPPVTRFVTEKHAMLLLLPVIFCALWVFWPAKVARLRIAMWFGWFSVLLMLMALGSMYLPIIEMASVVDAE